MASGLECLVNGPALLFFSFQKGSPRGHFLRNGMSSCISWLSCRTEQKKQLIMIHSALQKKKNPSFKAASPSTCAIFLSEMR